MFNCHFSEGEQVLYLPICFPERQNPPKGDLLVKEDANYFVFDSTPSVTINL